jgi:hypothetical protein
MSAILRLKPLTEKSVRTLLHLRFFGPFSAARIIRDDDPLRPGFGKKITRLGLQLLESLQFVRVWDEI